MKSIGLNIRICTNMNFKCMNVLLLLVIGSFLFTGCRQSGYFKIIFDNELIIISIQNSDHALWDYTIKETGKVFSFEGPQFEIDGKLLPARLISLRQEGKPVKLNNGVTESSYEGNLAEMPDVTLRMTFRVPDNNPIVKFRYEIFSSSDHQLTRFSKNDNLIYLSTSFENLSDVKEIRFSEFNEMVHSFCLSERIVTPAGFRDSLNLMGPVLVGSDGNYSFLLAYEHGSQVPDKFLEYSLHTDHSVQLKAVKGNYYSGYLIGNNHLYQTIWLETGAIRGTVDALAANYRNFVLHYMSRNLETRKPYIFYNTWNFQERNKHWNKKPYLHDMTLERMLKEIDVAHKMGIEVFVIDAGWFEKTGDWTPSLNRFPDGLKQVGEKLRGYGMKLGLWFNPTVASVSSNMLKNNRENVITLNGDEGKPFPVWETEESYGMCLVSPYRDAFADELIRLNKELGVTYFKWDAIGQYGCNDPRHFHGNGSNTAEERLNCYAFEIGRSMAYVVDKLAAACPDAIVDFDITEGSRSVGLGFLASGKYFLINNGPYYFNYDIPFDREQDNWNIFFYPGAARGWICRTPLTFDKWIPSVLFLTHYLPDDPLENQSIAVGSLILGQNGIWGDLPGISNEGIEFFSKTLSLYKQVRDEMTEVAMIRDGAVGGSPEIYEKINPATGRGAVVIFSSHTGKYSYITSNRVAKDHWETGGVIVSFDGTGLAKIDVEFKTAEAKIIFFGAE